MARKSLAVGPIVEKDGGVISQPFSPYCRQRRFRSRDIENIFSAAMRTGLTVSAVEITPDGRVTVRFGEGQIDPTEAQLDEELRLWRLERDRRERSATEKKRRG